MTQIFGVGFLLFAKIDGELKLFTIEELRDKPGISKSKGMISFPLETSVGSDNGLRGTIERAIKEEIGVSLERVNICLISKQEFRPIPNRPDIAIYYGAGIYLGKETKIFLPEDNDVRFFGWLTLRGLLSQNTRVEVAPIISHFLSSGNFSRVKQQS